MTADRFVGRPYQRSICERCGAIFVAETKAEAYRNKVEHWNQSHGK